MSDDWTDALAALAEAGARYLPPNRIDLLTTISGVPDFEAAWAERVEHAFGGRLVPFLGRATLIRNKRESGRRKDLADLEALGELPPSS